MGTHAFIQDNGMYMTAEEFWEFLDKTTSTEFVTEYIPRVDMYSQNGYMGMYEGKPVYITAETFSLTDLQEVL